MRIRPWHRRLTTRVCLACSAFFFCLIVGSCICSGAWRSPGRGFYLSAGEAAWEWGPQYPPPPDVEVGVIPRMWIPGVLKYGDIWLDPAIPVAKFVSLSVWLPFLLISLVAGSLIAYDTRRPLSGKCACGYDLTGNVSGVCPECGTRK